MRVPFTEQFFPVSSPLIYPVKKLKLIKNHPTNFKPQCNMTFFLRHIVILDKIYTKNIFWSFWREAQY